MRANVMKLWVAIGAVAVVSGCKCGDPTECGTKVFVTFDSPKQGATVTATTDVTISVKDDSGKLIELDTAQVTSRLTKNTNFGVPKDGTITKGKAVFSGVNLEPGANTIKASIKQKATSCTANNTIEVTVPTTMMDVPKVLTVAFPQDTQSPVGTLSSSELPNNADLRIDVTTMNADQGTVEIRNAANDMPLAAPVTIVGSAATVQVPAAMLVDGMPTFFAKVTKGALSNTQATNMEAVKGIILDRSAPTCVISAPLKTELGPNDDADATTMGYQLRAVGSTDMSAATLQFKITGGAALIAPSGEKAPVMNALSHDFTIPLTGSVTYALSLEAKDLAGNTCTATKMITADFEGPTLAIVSPDGGTETSFNVPLIASVMNGNGGTVEWKVTDSTGVRDLGIVGVDAGVASSVGSFLSGPQTISATPKDAIGNVGATVTRPFTVSPTTGCSIVFTRPATRPGFITAAQAPTGTYNFQAATSCASGTMVALKRDGVTVSTQAVGAGSVSWNVPVSTGTFTIRAEVGTVFDQLQVVVDLTAPAITQPFDGATLNIASDAAPGTPGIQRSLVFTATVPAGGHTDICSNQTPAPAGSTPCADGLAGWFTLKANVTSPDPTFTFPDGTYCVKLAVVSGVTTNVSTPNCLVVDSIAPTISGITLLRDANGDKKLNIAELNNLPPELQFTLGAGHVQANIKSITVKEGGVTFNSGAGVTYSGATLNVVNVKLDQNITATSATYSWVIEVEDLAGNKTSSPAQLVKVDKQAPTCAFTSPTVPILGRPSDAVTSTMSFDLDAEVTGSPDTATITFASSGGQVLTASAMAVGGTATNTFAFTQANGVTTYGLTATCTDDSGNSTTAAPIVGLQIDLDPPTCAMTAPIASPPQYSTLGLTTTVNVMGPGTVGQTVQILSQVGAGTAQPVGTLTVNASGVATGVVSYNTGVQIITATVSDPYGNVCTVPGRTIDINSAQCAIAFTSPTIGTSGKAFLTSTSFTVNGISSNCGAGKTVQLFRVGNVTPLGTGVTTAGGLVSITGTLPEGGPYTLRLRIDNGAALTTDSDLAPVYVDATNPGANTVELNTVVYPASGASVSFVAANNKNLLPPAPNATFVPDNALGGNADFSVRVTGVTGAIGGTVRVIYQGTEVASAAVGASPQDVTLNNVSLPHNTTGAFQIEVADEAGNVFRPVNVPGVVDVIEPGAPTVSRTLAPGPRPTKVTLDWMPTYDDGVASASGGHAGYEVRWSTSTVLNNNALATAADYQDSAKAISDSNVAWIGSANTKELTLPPNNTYYIVVRALDEVGNYSPYTAPPAVANPGTTDTLTNPSGVSDQFGTNMAAAGSLNNDAFDDLVVSAFSQAKVYVYFGGTTFTTQTACAGAVCQLITIPVAKLPANESFGNSIAVGKVTDTAAPGIIVGSANYNASQGRAFLFFGGANPDAGTYVDDSSWVEFRGTTLSDFGRSVAVLPDVDGDGIAEVAVTAQNFNSARGRVYIYKGRTKAAWLAAAAGTFIADTAASWVIDGPTPVPAGGNSFGAQRSISSVGPLTGGPGNDFTISAANEAVNSVYLVSSSAMLDAGTQPFTVTDRAFQTISRPQLGNPLAIAFGAAVVGNIDVKGAVAKDLVITSRKEQALFIYQDGTPTTFGNPAPGITGGTNFGSTLLTPDLNKDGVVDLVSSEISPTGSPVNVWVLYNHAKGYDSAVGQFYSSVFTGTTAAAGGIGTSLASGDFNGDGVVDLALSDRTSGFGRILIWR